MNDYQIKYQKIKKDFEDFIKANSLMHLLSKCLHVESIKIDEKVGPLLNYKLKNIVNESIGADLNMQDEDIINFIHFFMLTKRKHTIQPPI